MSTLQLISLRKEFGTSTPPTLAVNDLSLNVADGEFLCILGPSGCGKSTALRMIAGFEEPSAGDVRIDDASVIDMPPNKRPTAMVFQKYTLWPHMRVYDNIAFGLRLRHLSKADIDRDVLGSLDMVGLKNYGQRYPAQLSGGEQQRVAIARALVLKPKILLLDEPFSNLDALLRVRLREELRAIQRNLKITAVFVTHDQEEALSLADRIAVMNKGNLEQIDKPGAIYATPHTLFVADFIGAMNLMPASATGDTLTLGSQSLRLPSSLTASGLTVAIRPEDVRIGEGGWQGTVNGVSDLGHYQKVYVHVDGLPAPKGASNNAFKLYLPKHVDAVEGGALAFAPTRCMIFGAGEPIEVRL